MNNNLVALNPEFGKTPEVIPHTNLRRESTVKRLLKQGRYPTVLVRFEEQQFDMAQCFIPAGKSVPSESFEVSIDEARKIVAIRDRLARQH